MIRYPHAPPPERQRSMIDLRVMEEVRNKQRRSMAVGPYEDLPPHLRNHLVNIYHIPTLQIIFALQPGEIILVQFVSAVMGSGLGL